MKNPIEKLEKRNIDQCVHKSSCRDKSALIKLLALKTFVIYGDKSALIKKLEKRNIDQCVDKKNASKQEIEY